MKIQQFLFLTIASLTAATAWAAPEIDKVVAAQQARIHELETQNQQQAQELVKRTVQVVKNATGGNCVADFDKLVEARSQVTVYAKLYSGLTGVPFSAVFLVTKDQANRPSVRAILPSDAPGNNNGSIEWNGTVLSVTTGGVGANCSISMASTF